MLLGYTSLTDSSGEVDRADIVLASCYLMVYLYLEDLFLRECTL